jgi:hypothetical protein
MYFIDAATLKLLDELKVGDFIAISFTHYEIFLQVVSINRSQSAYAFVLKDESGTFSFLHYNRGDWVTEGSWILYQFGPNDMPKVQIARTQNANEKDGVYYFHSLLSIR